MDPLLQQTREKRSRPEDPQNQGSPDQEDTPAKHARLEEGNTPAKHARAEGEETPSKRARLEETENNSNETNTTFSAADSVRTEQNNADEIPPGQSFKDALALIPVPQRFDVEEWITWSNRVLSVCEEVESMSACLPSYEKELFDKGATFMISRGCVTAYIERMLAFCAILALCHVTDTLKPTEDRKIPIGAFFARQRRFFVDWSTERAPTTNNADREINIELARQVLSEKEHALLIELGELFRATYPNGMWDDMQYLANIPSMPSITNRINALLPLDRSSLEAMLLSIRRRKEAAACDAPKFQTQFFCGIDARTLRWQAAWWYDFWKMREFDDKITEGAREYVVPENCPYTNHWLLASLRETDWMRETLVHLQDYYFNDIALPGMSERGYQRAGFRNHSGNVLWSEFETLETNALRATMNHEALSVHDSLNIVEYKREEIDFHWEMLRAIYVVIARLLCMRFTKHNIEKRFFIYNMLTPRQHALIGPDPILVGIRQHFVLIHGNDRILYKRAHMLHAVADWMLMSFPRNDRIYFLMTAFRDDKMISPNDAVAMRSAKIVANDNSQRGFFRD